MAKISKEEQEKRIKEAGAGRYDFVRWSVDGEFASRDKCVVRCVNDSFEWSAKVNHLVNSVSGCPQCAGQRRWTAKERIEQINEIEGIEFVSWACGYNNQHSKANVKCDVDGFEWGSTVSNLVNGGHGCPQCAGQRRWTPKERIEQINKLEGIEFVSWVCGYENHKSKANVKCATYGHGWSASIHNLVIVGTGCPNCEKSGYDQSKKGTLYALRSECGRYVKVGISNRHNERIKDMERNTPFSFSCIEQISGDGSKIAELEKYLHNKYERAGFVGFDGCTEWLICTPELLEELRKLGD